MSNLNSDLKLPLAAEIDKTVEDATNKEFTVDPILGDERSAIQSILGSLLKRHGTIMEHSIVFAFKNSPFHTVIDPKGFKASTAADRLTEVEPLGIGSLPDLLHFPGQGRNISPDIIILDNRTAQAIAIEVKRANGPLDSGKKSQTIRDLQCMRMNVRSFVEAHGYHVRSGDAKVIEYYGKSGLPEELTLNKDTIDAFFGIQITDIVEASTEYLRRKIQTVLTQKFSNLAA